MAVLAEESNKNQSTINIKKKSNRLTSGVDRYLFKIN
jgi:hypothetical protein